MPIILIGVPGAGKTTIGFQLALELDISFIDTDHEIEKQAGKTISDIFIQDGEPAFRNLEKQVIAGAIAESDGVISVGGGALLDEGTRELVKNQTTVWLQAGLSQAVDRIGMNKNRPLLLGNVRGQLSDLMTAREPLYIECAKFVVDTNNLTIEEVVSQVKKVIGQNYVNN